MKIYADNAATTKMSQVAIDAMLPYFTNVYGNPSSLHSVGQEAKEALEDARARVAKCLGCEVLPYDDRYPNPDVWKVLDNKDAAKILQQKLERIEHGK